jgi:hypothetical protein
MRTFKNKWFTRFADKEGVSDTDLKNVIRELEAGQIDADLGSGVFKQRVARQGAGKRGGYRVIVFFKKGERGFFFHGFAKSRLANISDAELSIYKLMAKHLLALNDKQLEVEIADGTLKEF